MKANGWSRATGLTGALLCTLLGAVTACGTRAPETSGAGGGGAASVSSLSPDSKDVRLADADPTSSACLVSGETLVPFRVLTRLNRVEYDNTVRDLLGDTSHAALDMLPADRGDGAFDNNAQALTIDPALVQKYQTLAETLAENALAPNGPGRSLIFTCGTEDDTCARQIARDLARRAWRRPVTDSEVEALYALYTATRAAGFSFDAGIEIVVEGALMSPNFLFRAEIDAIPDAHSQHPIGPYELASRLSYLLWSTMPDEALDSAAANGDLATRSGLQQQVERMLGDPKAEAFYSRFPGQWLATLNVTLAKQPDPTTFVHFDAELGAAMEGETARFMRELMTTDTDFLGFLDAKFTYVNQRLAQFYNIPGTFDANDFTRVDLSGNTERGGILTHASVLTVTSPPDRTSPVMRGQWVLSRLLMTPAPPPPPNVPPISATPATGTMTFRERLEAHVSNPACASCHKMMDPIGFGMENYDGIGAWRTTDNGSPIDATGQLTNGQTFSGSLQLESILRTDSRVPNAIVHYLMSYALGREIGPDDQCVASAMAAAFHDQDNNRMISLVSRVTTMDAIRLRRASP